MKKSEKKAKQFPKFWRYVDYTDPAFLVLSVGVAPPDLPATASKASLMHAPLDTPQQRKMVLDYIEKVQVASKGKKAAAKAVEELCGKKG